MGKQRKQRVSITLSGELLKKIEAEGGTGYFNLGEFFRLLVWEGLEHRRMKAALMDGLVSQEKGLAIQAESMGKLSNLLFEAKDFRKAREVKEKANEGGGGLNE